MSRRLHCAQHLFHAAVLALLSYASWNALLTGHWVFAFFFAASFGLLAVLISPSRALAAVTPKDQPTDVHLRYWPGHHPPRR